MSKGLFEGMQSDLGCGAHELYTSRAQARGAAVNDSLWYWHLRQLNATRSETDEYLRHVHIDLHSGG